jgi:uncharacterized protein (DUF983 family)
MAIASGLASTATTAANVAALDARTSVTSLAEPMRPGIQCTLRRCAGGVLLRRRGLLQQVKKNPACAGSSSFIGALDSVFLVLLFSCAALIGVLRTESLLSVALPVIPQRIYFPSPSSSSVHHHHPHENDED